MEKTRYSRTEIYELLWVESATKVAQILGISDVGLGKWCKTYQVPKPKIGYWAKVHNGVSVPPREPLEPWWNDCEPFINVNHIEKAQIIARAHLEKINTPIWEIYDGNKFDIEIVKTFEDFSIDNVSKFGRSSSKQGFSVDISPKSLIRVKRILQTLISELKKEGYGTFDYKRYSNSVVTGFIKNEEKYSISIYEASKKLEKPIKRKKTWVYNGVNHEYYQTIEYGSGGKLELHLSHNDLYVRRSIKDTSKSTLESQLGKISVIFREMAVEAKAAREEREKRELQYQAEKKRKEDLLWARKVKGWKWEQLSTVSEEWDQLQKIRGFIEVVESNQTIKQVNTDYENWLAWAKSQLESKDPIKLAEIGELLPGQGEPDRDDFRIEYGWESEYDLDEDESE